MAAPLVILATPAQLDKPAEPAKLARQVLKAIQATLVRLAEPAEPAKLARPGQEVLLGL